MSTLELKTYKSASRLLPLAGAVALVLAGCTDQVPEIPNSELYTREWVKTFGTINGAHDWNNATRGSVDVDAPAGSDIRVTAEIGGKEYLLAHYADISGSRKISFDMPRGVNEVRVYCGESAKTAAIGSGVTFGIVDSTPGTLISSTVVEDEHEWMVVPSPDATIFRRKMPEGCYNANREGVHSDFMFRFKTNDIVVRPLFWQTSQRHTLGFYYMEGDEIVRVPVYHMDKEEEFSDDLVLYKVDSNTKQLTIAYDDPKFVPIREKWGVDFDELKQGAAWGYPDNLDESTTSLADRNVTMACREYMTDVLGMSTERDAPEDNRFNYVYRWSFDTAGTKIDVTYTYYSYGNPTAVGNGNNPNYNVWKNHSLVSKGIKVHFDDIDRPYGAYIEQDAKDSQGNLVRFYSMSERNPDQRWIPVGDRANGKYDGQYSEWEKVESAHASHATTWLGTKYSWRYLAFEDWAETDAKHDSDMDLNDIVFLIETYPNGGDDPVIIVDEEKPEPIKWLIACEDLGDKDDFDFNDVVFEVSHVAGETKAYITPLAAGGTLETYLMREDENGEQRQIGNEWHLNCGGTDFTTMINTTSLTFTPGEEHVIAIDVPEDFTITSDPAGAGYRKNMGGFFLRVTRADGSRVTDVTPPGIGEAPQMILLYQERGKWFWPVERTRISVAYSDFPAWASNPVYDVTDPDERRWYHNCSDVHVIKR